MDRRIKFRHLEAFSAIARAGSLKHAAEALGLTQPAISRTLKELEEYGPQEIVELLTGPMVRTIDRIRKALALNNRSLKGDERYAIEFLSAIGGAPKTKRASAPTAS